MAINISLFKYKKQAKATAAKLLEELETIHKIMDLSLKGLGHFSHHNQVQELTAILNCNIDLCKIYIANNKKIIENLEKDQDK